QRDTHSRGAGVAEPRARPARRDRGRPHRLRGARGSPRLTGPPMECDFAGPARESTVGFGGPSIFPEITMRSDQLSWLLAPLHVAALATRAKSFRDNPPLGSPSFHAR